MNEPVSAGEPVSLLHCSGDQVTSSHAETPMAFNVEMEFWKCPTCGREITPKVLRDAMGTMPWEEPT